VEAAIALCDSAAITIAARTSSIRSQQARAASPTVAALLDSSASASAGASANRGWPDPVGSQSRSPSRHNAVSASAVRSPVPMAPYRGTGTASPSLIPASSGPNMAGSTPEPPAAIWLTRTTSIARLSSAAISGPPPPA